MYEKYPHIMPKLVAFFIAFSSYAALYKNSTYPYQRNMVRHSELYYNVLVCMSVLINASCWCPIRTAVRISDDHAHDIKPIADPAMDGTYS